MDMIDGYEFGSSVAWFVAVYIISSVVICTIIGLLTVCCGVVRPTLNNALGERVGNISMMCLVVGPFIAVSVSLFVSALFTFMK